MKAYSIAVPGSLGNTPVAAEAFYRLLRSAPDADSYSFDMAAIGFLQPYGVMALLSAARLLAARVGAPVELHRLIPAVQLYLDRMDVFDVASEWLRPSSAVGESWDRNPHTVNLLELTPIGGRGDVEAAIDQVRSIFTYWLDPPYLGYLSSVLSELCNNVHEHSGDQRGHILVQKHELASQGQVAVRLAVGDLGRGIRDSLVARHGEIGQEPLDYLREALAGRSARASGRGGLGLRVVERTIAPGGYLWLRSDTAALVTRGPGLGRGRDGLACIPGTQLAVELRAPV